MDNLSSKFISVFNVLEKWMRLELDAPSKRDIPSLLDELEKSNPAFRANKRDLQRLAALRNVLVHEHNLELPLGMPTLESIERLEKLVDILTSPKPLMDFAAKNIIACKPSDALGLCVRKMHQGDFSQLPVYDEKKYIGLLTTETITRWLAAFFLGDGEGIVEEQSVAEVIVHQNEDVHVMFMPRTATVESAINEFEKYMQKGKRLEAILITHSGAKTESLLGIVTFDDIPRLNKVITS